MSVFNALLAEVWSAAREDGSTLLADFAAPSSDAVRAARALRLPQLSPARRALQEHVEAFSRQDADRDRLADAEVLGGKSGERARRALARAQDAKDLEAILALSEAIRFSQSGAFEEALALGSRGRALLRLQQADAGLQDLRRARQLLKPLVNKASDTSTPTTLWPVYLRIFLDTASCLEVRGYVSEAEAVLREAMAAVRDAADRLSATDKTQAVGDIMQRLKKLGSAQPAGTPPPPLLSSGLDALPRLLVGPHPTLTSASAALEERVDARRGRHLVAAQNIPAGSAIIVERPYAWSLALEEMATHCLHCCSPVLAPLSCPQCSTVVFCGEDCRRAALSSYHRRECPLLRQLVAPQGQGDLSPMALLAFRIVVRAARLGEREEADYTPRLPKEFVDLYRSDESGSKKKRNKNRGGHLDGYGPVFAQVTHSEQRTPADLLKRAVTAAFLTCCLEAVLLPRPAAPAAADGQKDAAADAFSEDEARLLTTAFLRHLQSCSCNAYQISEHRCGGPGGVRASRGVELGGACYPTVSLVNHACYPNVARHSHGSVCVVRAVRLIPKGAEVLDNYGPHFLELDAEERRATLAKQYMFDCECDACRGDWPTLEELVHLPQLESKAKGNGKQQNVLRELSARLQHGVQGLLEGRTEEALQAAIKYSSTLQQQQKGLPPCAEQVRADQVAALCWSLAGNRADF